MTATPKVIIAAQDAPNAQTTLYTSPLVATGGKGTWIDKFTATNYSGGTVTLSVNIVTLAGAAGNSNLVVKTKAITAGATDTLPELVGKFLNPGDFISVIAGAATSIAIASNGRELT